MPRIGLQNSSPTQVAPSTYKLMDTNPFCARLIDFQIPLVMFSQIIVLYI